MRRSFGLGLVLALLVALIPFAGANAATISTTTVLEAPNQYGVNASMPLRIQVTNDEGASAPTGTVTLQDNVGRTITTASLQPTDNGGYSWAYIDWWSNRLGFNQLRAVYNPSGTTFAASQSTLAGILILESTPTAVLRMPDRFVVGTPANITALINQPVPNGTAALQVNNRSIYGSTQVNAANEVPFPWTPTTSTQYTFLLEFTNATASNWGRMEQAVFAVPN